MDLLSCPLSASSFNGSVSWSEGVVGDTVSPTDPNDAVLETKDLVDPVAVSWWGMGARCWGLGAGWLDSDMWPMPLGWFTLAFFCTAGASLFSSTIFLF